ncbi:hypothetical protein ACLF3G_03845 [Falsiroseomonas sp. HC035]|uniref:hypothetical protein n=1 Tax=Falsiroseomonas sp. HC035 TaxID=3390999 RepID=UPI003D310129
MLKWVVGIAVALTALALVARVLQLGISLALIGVAVVAAVIAAVLGLVTRARSGSDSDAS